ncbi:MAG: putative iron-dependent peroxidase [Planctomycetota bacterium]|jgi:putative iron-dependent peroxidase
MTIQAQPGILEPVPPLARYLTFRLVPGADPVAVLVALGKLKADASCVYGLGQSLVQFVGAQVPGLRSFPNLEGPGVGMPGTAGALWCWLRGDDRGELLHQGRAIAKQLAGCLELTEVTSGFRYGASLDLTGFVDGTENPKDEHAVEVGFVSGADEGLSGGSFVAVQKWQHDLAQFEAMSSAEQDATIGRRKVGNEEISDAPPAAHVKRTEQEAFDPEAFVLRRSMPWADGMDEGLVFVAFGASFDAFEVLAHKMLGLDDGIVDALFRFTRATTGSYYWCPPISGSHLDLRSLTGACEPSS